MHHLVCVVVKVAGLVNVVDLSPAGSGRMVIALAVFGVLAILVWQTMEPGKFRTLVFVVLGGLALRVLLGSRRADTDTRAR